MSVVIKSYPINLHNVRRQTSHKQTMFNDLLENNSYFYQSRSTTASFNWNKTPSFCLVGHYSGPRDLIRQYLLGHNGSALVENLCKFSEWPIIELVARDRSPIENTTKVWNVGKVNLLWTTRGSFNRLMNTDRTGNTDQVSPKQISWRLQNTKILSAILPPIGCSESQSKVNGHQSIRTCCNDLYNPIVKNEGMWQFGWNTLMSKLDGTVTKLLNQHWLKMKEFLTHWSPTWIHNACWKWDGCDDDWLNVFIKKCKVLTSLSCAQTFWKAPIQRIRAGDGISGLTITSYMSVLMSLGYSCVLCRDIWLLPWGLLIKHKV